MALYGNTGNTTPTGITAGQLSDFQLHLPRDYQSVPEQIVSGSAGPEQLPTSPVVIISGDSDYSYDFDGGTNFLLAGTGAKVDLTPSHGSSEDPLQIDLTLLGHDTIKLNHGQNYVHDNGGYNNITTRGGNDTVESFGHNLINVRGDGNVIYGNTQDTINLGKSTNDVVDAGQGRETITGGQGAIITGYGHTSISGGVNNTVYLRGHDTLSGSTNDTVSVAANSSVYIDGKTSTGMTVDIAAGKNGHVGNDTIFGGGQNGVTINAASLGSFDPSNVTTDPNNSAIHVLHFTSGDTLSVNNVTVIDTNGTHKI